MVDQTTEPYDAVVVGSGAGGAMAAYVLTKAGASVLMLEAAMPTAVFPIKLAKLYKGDPATAMRAVLSTAVVSPVTIPLWIKFGMRFVGL